MCFHILVNPFLDIFSIFLNEFNNCHYMNIKNLQINYVSRTQSIMSWNQSVSLIFFCLILKLFSCYQDALFSLHMRVFTLSYCICFVFLGFSIQTACSFLKRRSKGRGSRKKRRQKGVGRSVRMGTTVRIYVLYEGRMYLKKIKCK